MVVWGLSLAGGVGVVLDLVVPGVVLGGVACSFSLLGGVSRLRGPASPLDGRVFCLVSIHLTLARLAFCLNIYIYIYMALVDVDAKIGFHALEKV